MTHAKALAVRAACDAAGVVGLVCHTEQWSDNSHYVELPVIPPWTLAAWRAEDAAMLRPGLAA